METLSPEVLEDLRHGRAPRERKLAVCSTGAHIPAVDRAEILTVLAQDSDELVSSRAQEALLSDSLEVFVEAINREHPLPALFAYVARNFAAKPGIVDALVANQKCPGEQLAIVVPHLTPAHVEALFDELDRITLSSTLAVALEHHPGLTADQKSTLQELRSTAVDEGRLADAAAEAEPDPIRRQTLLQQITRMTVSQRVQFAMKGGSEARRTLIRDSNKVVQRAVLQSPRLTDQEVEAFASMPNLTEEILRAIATNRNFRKNYVVVRNLMNNPKTPLDVSLHMLPILNVLDLKRLAMNKNIPETLRSTANKLMRTRADLKR
ncbi:MAG: hypothetical protein ACHQT6_04950 [Candidatus Acidiferrales bacterium]